MSKITITPLRQQTGVYGTVRAHQPVELDAEQAQQLVKTGRWVKGLTDEAKRLQEGVAQRVADEAAAKARAEEQAEADAEAARLADEEKAKAEADAAAATKGKVEAETSGKAKTAKADK